MSNVWLNPDVVFAPRQHGGIVYDNIRRRTFHVNDTAMVVLKACNGRHTREEIIQLVATRYGVPIQTVAADIAALLNSLESTNILSVSPPITLAHRDPIAIHGFYLSLEQCCNLRCSFCYAPPLEDSRAHDRLLLKGWQSIIDQIATLYPPVGVRFYFTGGEPLLHPDFFPIAQYAIHRGFKTALFTNGTLIDAVIASRLIETGFDSIIISMDGATAATHDRSRGVPGVFTKAIEATTYLLSQGPRMELGWQTVATTINYHEIESLIDLAARTRIQTLRIGVVTELGRAAGGSLEQLTPLR